jgi:hypothetical protein
MAANTRLFFRSLLIGMGINGVLYLGLLLLPPSPHKAGLWFWVYNIMLPYFSLIGVLGLVKRQQLDLPWQIGALLLLYALLLAAWGNSFYIGLAGLVARLPAISAELIPILLFVLTLTAIIQVMREEYYL